MSFNYATKIDGIVDVLYNHATASASPFLSDGLTTPINKELILADDPQSRGLRNDEYPCIFVRLSNAEEDFSGVGPTGLTGAYKQKTVFFDILCFYRREGVNQTNPELLSEIYKLAENVESVLREEFTASGTALWIAPRSTDFLGPFNDGTSWIKVAQMQVEGKYHFR